MTGGWIYDEHSTNTEIVQLLDIAKRFVIIRHEASAQDLYTKNRKGAFQIFACRHCSYGRCLVPP